MELHELKTKLETELTADLTSCEFARGELTIEVPASKIYRVCDTLRENFKFEQLMDVAGVDYLHYGLTEWQTYSATSTGFDRGVEPQHDAEVKWDKPRFAVVYHLLSIANNIRLRVRSFVDAEDMQIDSVVGIWASANWFEREAFDMYGILFNGHPDLRRILTDYGFIGHAFRKDFPLSGHVEVRYDQEQERVIYEPVSIEPRILVPKTIRHDNRYQEPVPLPPKEEVKK